MRTTVTLAEDVVAALDEHRRDRSIGRSDAVNDLLRAGLAASAVGFAPRGSAGPLQTAGLIGKLAARRPLTVRRAATAVGWAYLVMASILGELETVLRRSWRQRPSGLQAGSFLRKRAGLVVRRDRSGCDV